MFPRKPLSTPWALRIRKTIPVSWFFQSSIRIGRMGILFLWRDRCFRVLNVLLTAVCRLWRTAVVSIAAAMTHNYSFFAARILGRSQEMLVGNFLSHAFLRAAKMNVSAAVYALCGVWLSCGLLRRG